MISIIRLRGVKGRSGVESRVGGDWCSLFCQSRPRCLSSASAHGGRPSPTRLRRREPYPWAQPGPGSLGLRDLRRGERFYRTSNQSAAEGYLPKFGRPVATPSRGWSPQRYDRARVAVRVWSVSLRTVPRGVSQELAETNQEGGCEGRNDQRATKIWNGHIFVISSVALMKALLAGW